MVIPVLSVVVRSLADCSISLCHRTYYLSFSCVLQWELMKKLKAMRRKKLLFRSSSLLPIDTRILPDIISFGHVHGVAKLFLQIEIILSLLVVIGTLILVVFRKI